MPRNENFKLTDESVEIVFPSVGVLSTSGSVDTNEPIVGAYYDSSEAGKGTYVLLPNGGIKYFDLDKSQLASVGDANAKLVFQDDENVYLIRGLIEDDGVWLSNYKIVVPTQVLESKVSIESRPAIEAQLGIPMESAVFLPFFETLVIYYRDNMDLILDVVYMTSAGSFSRQDAGWVPVDISDDKYEDIYVAEVQPDKAKEFLDLYDVDAEINVEKALQYTSSN